MSKFKKFVVTVAEADTPNKNKRVYPRHVLEQQVERMKETIKQRALMGETGTPKQAAIQAGKASHIVTDMYMEGDCLMAEIEILDTPAGQDLKSLLSAGIPIGFRMSGVGGGDVDKEGNFVVNDSYKMIQIFATNDPA